MWVSTHNRSRPRTSGSVVFLALAVSVPILMMLLSRPPATVISTGVTDVVFCDTEVVEDDHFISGANWFYGGVGQSSDRAFSGTYSCKLDRDNIYGIRYDIPDPISGVKYKASVWASRTGGNRAHLVVANNDASFYVEEIIPVLRRDDGWELLELFFSVPDKPTDLIKVYVYVTQGSGAVYYDNFKLEKLEVTSVPPLATPRVEISMDKEAFRKLTKKKWDAIANGILISDDTDWVTADLQTNGGSDIPVEIRLKGDWLDHLKKEKWSLRIKVKNQQSWNKLVTFSIQSPETRFYLREWLYHKLLETADVLTPRYDFMHVTLNQRPLGLYAYEEHFEKQLIESKRRREGPILKLSEDGFWLNYKRQEDIYAAGTIPERMTDAFWQSEILPFKAKKIVQTAVQLEAFERARDLLYGYKYNLLSAGEVFDLDVLARYYAVTDIQQAYHGIVWHNQRFYYNPITGALEPIGFDGFGDLTAPVLGSGPFLGYYAHINSTENLFGKLFGDAEFVRKYHRALLEFSAPGWYEPIYLSLQEEIADREALLAEEYSDSDLDLDGLRKRAREIRYYLSPLDDISLLARAHAKSDAAQTVRVANHYQLPLDVVGYTGTDKAKIKRLEIPRFVPSGLRFQVPPSEDIEVPLYAKFIVFQLAGIDSVRYTKISAWSAPDPSIPSQAFAPTDLGVFSFVRTIGAEAVIRAGHHTIATDCVFPKGMSLMIEPGTTLDIVEGARFIVQGTVKAIGHAEAPIVIQSSDYSAAGFTVLQADDECVLQFVRFDGLNTMSAPGHTLTGAVTFYESDVKIRNCSFTNSQCEDALNTVRCHIDFDGIHIANTRFDGFDADFCDGVIKRATFNNISNDAMDFSGSSVVIHDCVVKKVGDKGISVGEESRIKVINATLEDCNIGVASKDLSRVEVVQITLRNCKQGFTAYQKKPEFGPAELIVRKYTLDHVKRPYLIERGSRLILGDREITGQ